MDLYTVYILIWFIETELFGLLSAITGCLAPSCGDFVLLLFRVKLAAGPRFWSGSEAAPGAVSSLRSTFRLRPGNKKPKHARNFEINFTTELFNICELQDSSVNLKNRSYIKI